ncbi:GNAT family N-acetyltransferase [Paenibacillus popilliae]|uniref:N-acetyltransferase n=1 Tax=Paenibacillus popilliae TaxID=78057 RepID=A0ABY3AV33_PAEPP|nr:GNAT family protein [Paenibacillus sp. SDF0028]TQR46276.1 N-acetyltransferase [Paenibacillus sp. SDF0028]
MKIDGDRVFLSRVTSDDLDFVCELETNTGIWLYEEQVESDKEKVRNKYLEQMNSTSQYDFVITKEADGKSIPVGLAQIWSYSEHRKSWELGFAIIPEFQGHGYGLEAINLLLDFSFHQLGAHKVVAMCNCHNMKSMNLMEKLGMRREGTFKEELMWKGQWVDQYFYAILDTDYIKKRTHLYKMN